MQYAVKQQKEAATTNDVRIFCFLDVINALSDGSSGIPSIHVFNTVDISFFWKLGT